MTYRNEKINTFDGILCWFLAYITRTRKKTSVVSALCSRNLTTCRHFIKGLWGKSSADDLHFFYYNLNDGQSLQKCLKKTNMNPGLTNISNFVRKYLQIFVHNGVHLNTTHFWGVKKKLYVILQWFGHVSSTTFRFLKISCMGREMCLRRTPSYVQKITHPALFAYTCISSLEMSCSGSYFLCFYGLY